MVDSGAKIPENRIHLFDPVGLINDSYGGTYRSSSYAVKPRRPTKSYGNFKEVNSNGGLKSFEPSFTSNNTEANGVAGIRSYDSFTDPSNIELRSYESFSMKTNVDDEKNGVEIRFGLDNSDNNSNSNVFDEEVSTPRLWKSNSPKSPNNNNNDDDNNNNNNNKPLNNTSYFHDHTTDNVNIVSSPPFKSINNVNVMSSSPFNPTNNSMSSTLNSTSPKHHQYTQNMSPSSRTRAIAKGRRELMDMVRDLPESFYELSLKDIVEQRVEFGGQKGKVIDISDNNNNNKKGIAENNNGSNLITKNNKKVKKIGKKVKKSESKKKMVRSKSVEHNGRFLLRTSVFPIFSRSRKNKKRLGGNNSFKVAPMPNSKASSSSSMKVVEKDWWRRKSSMPNEGEDVNGLSNKSLSSSDSSCSSSSRSNNDNIRRNSRFLPTCCLFTGRRIRSKK